MIKRPVRTFVFALVVLVTVILVGSVRAEATAARPFAVPLAGQEPQPTDEALGGDEKPIFEGGAPVAAEDLVFSPPRDPAAAVDGTEFQAAPNSPTITVWYGTTQPFGQNGDPQKWVNILGKVTNPTPISSLTYSLNGGPQLSLNRGPDQRRVTQAGDFIIEIDYTDLQNGANQVAITASDGTTTPTVANVTINYDAGNNSWTPGTYTYNWGTASKISDHGQIVTGEWTLNQAEGIIKPVLFAYDRLVALGDLTWRDYTITVPITIHSIDEGGFPAPSNGPGVGVLVRWQGHFDLNDTFPRVGWRRLGALAWHRWAKSGDDITSGYELLGHGGSILASDARGLTFGETYIYKIGIQSNGPTQPATYRFKVWDADDPEPPTWDFEEQGNNGEPKAGSIILLAHHVDAEFGTVTVQLNSTQPLPTLTVNTTGNGAGTVTRTPNKNPYLFGEDVQLTAVPGPDSTFAGWSGAISGTANPATVQMFGDRTVTAIFTSNSAGDTPASDDFSGCALNTDLWTFIDPLDDSTLTMNGTQAQISIPAGTKHDLFTDGRNAPRLMQFIENEDFEIEAKFDATLNARTQMQGMLVEGDAENYVRFNFQWDNTNYKIFAISFNNGSPTTRINEIITGSEPIYMQVERVGNDWTLRYSADGNAWTPLPSFNYALNATGAGVYVGTAGQNPAFSGLIDYFFDSENPIEPEDGPITLDVAKVGNGQVVVNPQKATYTCGEEVTLTATPDSGWAFSGWSGDAGGTNPAITITMDRAKDVTATFVASNQYTLTVNEDGNGSVVKDPDQPTYGQGTVVTLTAVPDLGYQFAGWSGALTGTTNPATITMDANKTVTATFTEAPQRTLTITVVGQGGVAKNPDKLTYTHGEVVTLTAVPAADWAFGGWGGALTGNENPTTIVMEGDKAVAANFFLNQYTLDVTVAGSGSVTKNPNKPLYYQGEVVTLTAVPGPESVFINWTGGVNSAINPVTVTMTGNKAVTATFADAGGYSLTVNVLGNGQVDTNPDELEYDFGEMVTLTAVGVIGHKFISWGGSVVSTDNPLLVTVNQNMNLTATFQQAPPYTLTLNDDGNGSAISTPNKAQYLHGETVRLDAQAAPGYAFAGWTGDVISNADPLQLVMDGNKSVVANFTDSTDPQSDDFSGCGLNDQWEFVNPRGDGSYTINGTQVTITVPGTDPETQISSDHNIWKDGNFTARLMQPAANTDFELEAKFESAVTERYQMQGIVVEESPNRFLRFDFFSDGVDPDEDEVHVYAASIDRNANPGIGRVRRNVIIDPAADDDLYLRIRRAGDKWFLWYSFNGENWITTGGSFSETLQVTKVGVYAGNTGTPGEIPAHTAVIDYFFNNAAPIDPEDGGGTGIDLTIDGQGQVNRNPNKETYDCGEQVQLTAVPNPGWRFLRWSGDLTGTNPVASLTIDGPQVITATFSPTQTRLYLPAVLR